MAGPDRVPTASLTMYGLPTPVSGGCSTGSFTPSGPFTEE